MRFEHAYDGGKKALYKFNILNYLYGAALEVPSVISNVEGFWGWGWVVALVT